MKKWFHQIKEKMIGRDVSIPSHLKVLNALPKACAPNEIHLYVVVRNGENLLPAFLKHYRTLGVVRFFIIDNDSEDQTAAYLLDQQDVHLFQTKELFKYSKCGRKWVRPLMMNFSQEHWCFNVDVDEFFIYPCYEQIKLSDLCQILEREGSTAVYSLLLDMYPEHAIRETHYIPGEDPLQHQPFFDCDTHFKIETIGMFGGVRRRVFEIMPRLDKWSFFYFDHETIVGDGMHDIQTKSPSEMQFVSLHFKFLDHFIEAAQKESKRGQHWNDAVEYKAYKKKLDKDPHLSLFCEQSQKFKCSEQLLELNLMKVTKSYREMCGELLQEFQSVENGNRK